jgi:hypothetical protein
MAKSRPMFPRSIARMIRIAKRKGWNATEITDHINNTKTAERMGLYYSTRSVATKLGNFTRDRS